jgi:hypothetical protein
MALAMRSFVSSGRSKLSNLTDFARSELERAGLFDSDADYNGQVAVEVMKLIEQFVTAGHSGGSRELALEFFNRLVNFEPLTPLTGEPDEWFHVEQDIWMNKRCCHVFKDRNGAYDEEGRIFRTPGGATYTGHKSRVSITFPYMPRKEIVNVTEEEMKC